MTDALKRNWLPILLFLLVGYALYLFLKESQSIGSALKNAATAPFRAVSGIWDTATSEVGNLWNYFTKGDDVITSQPSPTVSISDNSWLSGTTTDGGSYTLTPIDQTTPSGLASIMSNNYEFTIK